MQPMPPIRAARLVGSGTGVNARLSSPICASGMPVRNRIVAIPSGLAKLKCPASQFALPEAKHS